MPKKQMLTSVWPGKITAEFPPPPPSNHLTFVDNFLKSQSQWLRVIWVSYLFLHTPCIYEDGGV